VYGRSVDLDSDDNIYIAGSNFATTFIFGSQQVANNGPAGTGDILVCSFTTDGGYRWAKVNKAGRLDAVRKAWSA
jgi:hypothetical protein